MNGTQLPTAQIGPNETVSHVFFSFRLFSVSPSVLRVITFGCLPMLLIAVSRPLERPSVVFDLVIATRAFFSSSFRLFWNINLYNRRPSLAKRRERWRFFSLNFLNFDFDCQRTNLFEIRLAFIGENMDRIQCHTQWRAVHGIKVNPKSYWTEITSKHLIAIDFFVTFVLDLVSTTSPINHSVDAVVFVSEWMESRRLLNIIDHFV